MVFTGPPYFNQRSYSHWDTYDLYLDGITKVIKNCILKVAKGAVFALQVGRGSSKHKDHIGYCSVILDKLGLQFQDAIAWIKPSANYSIKRSCHISSNGFYYPGFKWETILIYRNHGPMPRMSIQDRRIMSKYHTDVWAIPWVTNQMKRFGHPSVCPIEIPNRCIRAYAPKQTYILDPFGGSGTTLIAANNAQRKCLTMERKPEYCKIILDRWKTLTGNQIYLVDDED